jgi:hypothetical protein
MRTWKQGALAITAIADRAETAWENFTIETGDTMRNRPTAINLLAGKNVASKSLIIDQALIELLIEKNVLSEAEIQARINEITKEVDMKDPYK